MQAGRARRAHLLNFQQPSFIPAEKQHTLGYGIHRLQRGGGCAPRVRVVQQQRQIVREEAGRPFIIRKHKVLRHLVPRKLAAFQPHGGAAFRPDEARDNGVRRRVFLQGTVAQRERG